MIGMITVPVENIGPESRRGKDRWVMGVDTGAPLGAAPPTNGPTATTFREASENIYAAHHMVYSCVFAYAETLAALPRRVFYQEPGGPAEPVYGHDLNRLLEQPGGPPNEPNGTGDDGHEFFADLATSIMIGGEGPVEKVWNAFHTKPVRLFMMRPDCFGPIVDPRHGLVGYQYVTGGQAVGYDRDEVIFYKLPNPTNEWRGLSPLSAARLAVEPDIKAAQFNQKFIENGAMPFGVISTEQDLLDREKKEVRSEWRAVHAGINRAGFVAVLDKGMTFNGKTMNHADMQWLEGRRFNESAVQNIYHCPDCVVAKGGSANRSTAEVEFRFWVMGPFLSLVSRIEHKLTWELAHDFDPNLKIKFDMGHLYRPDMTRLAQAGSQMWWLTPDEKREWSDMPPLPDGEGKKIYIPVNMAMGGAPVNEVRPPEEQPAAEGPAGAKMRPFGR